MKNTIGVGVDIVEFMRFDKSSNIEMLGKYFLTPNEINESKTRADLLQFMASRFALKEAVIKAYPVELKPYQFEIYKKNKKPMVRFISPFLPKYRMMISLSHEPNYAVGYAVCTI